jgi:hypothetical protein
MSASGGAPSPTEPFPRVLGDDRDLALAGPPGAEARPAGAAPPPEPTPSPAVHLGAPREGVAEGDVVWLPGPAPEVPPPGARIIATSGEGLWSRAPWPAHDELFASPRMREPLAVLYGGDDERRAGLAEKLAARRLPAVAAGRLTREAVADAWAVALLGPADAATPEAPSAATSMPAEAPAVLAARRVLRAPRGAVTFGLLPGTDHLAFGTDDDVVQDLDAVLTFPRPFDPFRTLGAVAAERHRASVVYARLAAELRSAPRSSAPRG